MPLGMIPNGAQKNIFFKEDITMGMVVQHNMNAINSYNKLNANVAGMKKSSEKLSSGYRINRAGDDAAGLAVSEKMRSQIKGLNQAIRNSQDGINMIQTFEGAAQETHSILQRMKELASQSANGTYDNATDRAAIQLEFDQLNDELNQIADTDFNGTIVLNGGKMADGTVVDGNGIIDYSSAVRKPQQLGTTGNFVKGIGKDGYTGTEKETVTFTASIDKDGNVIWDAGEAKGTLAMNANNGGFSYNGATIHVDTTKVVAGDTLVIEFNPAVDAKGKTAEVTGSTTTADAEIGKGTFTKAALSITAGDADIVSTDIADAINSLNGLTVKTTTTAGVTAAATTSTYNGQTVTAAGVALNDKVFAKLNGATVELYAGTDATGAKIGEIAAATITGADGTTKAGSYTTVWNTTTASYSPAKTADIKVVEPESKVSQANSFNKSTAIMTYASSITLQTGARTKDSVNFTFNYNADKTADMGDLEANLNISARKDGLNTENLSLATQEDANNAIDQIDKAINKTSMIRATFGSIQNRLEHKITNLTTTSENLTEAESSIRDTDMASEMMNYTKMNILQQAAQSMLAQANQQPQSILQLLG